MIFISYSHDSPAHQELVLSFSERLRQDGHETSLDLYVNGSLVQGWARWMLDEIDKASFVLVVCTETYYRRFRGHEESGRGRGADWEGRTITENLYYARSRNTKFVPILFTPECEQFIPEPLRGTTFYTLTSEKSYEELRELLDGVAGKPAAPVIPCSPWIDFHA